MSSHFPADLNEKVVENAPKCPFKFLKKERKMAKTAGFVQNVK